MYGFKGDVPSGATKWFKPTGRGNQVNSHIHHGAEASEVNKWDPSARYPDNKFAQIGQVQPVSVPLDQSVYRDHQFPSQVGSSAIAHNVQLDVATTHEYSSKVEGLVNHTIQNPTQDLNSRQYNQPVVYFEYKASNPGVYAVQSYDPYAQSKDLTDYYTQHQPDFGCLSCLSCFFDNSLKFQFDQNHEFYSIEDARGYLVYYEYEIKEELSKLFHENYCRDSEGLTLTYDKLFERLEYLVEQWFLNRTEQLNMKQLIEVVGNFYAYLRLYHSSQDNDVIEFLQFIKMGDVNNMSKFRPTSFWRTSMNEVLSGNTYDLDDRSYLPDSSDEGRFLKEVQQRFLYDDSGVKADQFLVDSIDMFLFDAKKYNIQQYLVHQRCDQYGSGLV